MESTLIKKRSLSNLFQLLLMLMSQAFVATKLLELLIIGIMFALLTNNAACRFNGGELIVQRGRDVRAETRRGKASRSGGPWLSIQ